MVWLHLQGEISRAHICPATITSSFQNVEVDKLKLTKGWNYTGIVKIPESLFLHSFHIHISSTTIILGAFSYTNTGCVPSTWGGHLHKALLFISFTPFVTQLSLKHPNSKQAFHLGIYCTSVNAFSTFQPFACPTFCWGQTMIAFLGCCKTQAEQTPGLKCFFAFSYVVFKLHYEKGGGTGLDNDSAGCHIKFYLLLII